MVRPLHQLNYNPNGRFYSTGLDPSCSLNEVGLSRDAGGAPVISGFTCLDTQGQAVSEDIILANSNVQQYMIVTFLGGTGGDDGGSVGVFDA